MHRDLLVGPAGWRTGKFEEAKVHKIRPFRLTHQPFPKATKESNRVLMSVFTFMV